MASAGGRQVLRAWLPEEPLWIKQVHGVRVFEKDSQDENLEADAAITRRRGNVCVVKIADCMPVLFADDAGTAVGVAHAGWRGLAAGVLENTLLKMKVEPRRLMAWLGPALR